MFAAGRIEKIKEVLLGEKRIEVAELTKILNVSEATVRRDLEKLEADGFLLRTHGGAVLASYTESQDSQSDDVSQEKKMVAMFAKNLVCGNEIVFIGGGGTCFQFAREIADKKDITVVTCNLDAANVLADRPNIEVLLTGGSLRYRPSSIMMAGPFAQAMLGEVFVDKAFLGADGADMDYGFSSANADGVELARIAMKISGQTIMLCDESKFDRKALFKICDLKDVSMVVTNPDIRAEYKTFFYEQDIPVLSKYDI